MWSYLRCAALISLTFCMSTSHGFSNVRKSHHDESFSKLSRLVETSCLTLSILASSCTSAYAASTEILAVVDNPPPQLSWQLPNGAVELSDPLASFSRYKLTNPILLGSGGGGAVFATHPLTGPNSDIAVKISWVRSASSVERECKVLQDLELKHTRNVERCLGMETYPPDRKRVMIALKPVVDNAVASVDQINQDVQPLAVQSIVRTLLDMLNANVVTADVQTLMEKETGSVVFIDMTEAQTMASPPSFLDLALASSFCSEIIALIPVSLAEIASKTFFDELSAFHSQGVYFPLPIYELLREQDVLLNSKSAEMIDSIITPMLQ